MRDRRCKEWLDPWTKQESNPSGNAAQARAAGYILLAFWWYHYTSRFVIELIAKEIEDFLKKFTDIGIASICTVK
jgi:hypothetical protein